MDSKLPKKKGKDSIHNIADFWLKHFKASLEVTTKQSAYECFITTEFYYGENYQTFTALSGRVVSSTKNKTTKNKLYTMVPKSPAAIEYFKLNGNHPPTQITDHIENKVNKDEVIADEVVDFTVNNTLEEGVKEHGEDDEDQGEEYSEASENNLEEFTIIDEYKMEQKYISRN